MFAFSLSSDGHKTTPFYQQKLLACVDQVSLYGGDISDYAFDLDLLACTLENFISLEDLERYSEFQTTHSGESHFKLNRRLFKA